MSNILKVTTPTTGYENTTNRQSNVSQAENMNIKNPVAPDRVVRPDGRPDGNADQGVRQGISSESNFGNFVQSLGDMTKLQEVMSKMVFGGMANLVEAGITKGTAEEISSMFQMLQMTPEQLKEFLKSQTNGANKFQGPLFQLMRQVMSDATTVELKSSILNFLKKYNDMSSGNHILQNIKGELEEIGKYMFRNDRNTLQSLTKQLHPYSLEENNYNTAVLKEKIIPFLGQYISNTRDMGKIRDLISLLTFNVSRYENGNIDGVTQAFQRLAGFETFQKRFAGMEAEEFRNMLLNVDFDRAAGKEEWSDKLLKIIQAGVKGEAGIENREAFQTVMKGMLMNESVYMPVMHVMLPAVLNGVPLFSELWIDPNEESGEKGSEERGVKLLIKFDLKEVGFFDIMMYYEKGKMDMLVHYPEELTGREGEIREGIADILKRNHINVEYLAVEKGKEPIAVSAAFPKIFERRSSVDVAI